MPLYRLYIVNRDGHVAGAPAVVDCPDDEAAIRRAQKHLDERAIEVWISLDVSDGQSRTILKPNREIRQEPSYSNRIEESDGRRAISPSPPARAVPAVQAPVPSRGFLLESRGTRERIAMPNVYIECHAQN